MLDNEKIEQSCKIIKLMISDRVIVAPEPLRKSFFLNKSIMSLNVAKKLLEMQNKEDINANMWIINTSYYAMFFAATALLAHHNHKINSEVEIHKLTYHALVYYFIKQENKLKYTFASDYKDAVEDAEQLLQLGQKQIEKLITDLDYEQDKRKRYTYEMAQEAETQKAETSLNRAKEFVDQIKRMVE